MIEIDREHPDFKRQRHMWRKYRDLYTGGQEFNFRAADYLVRRQREPLDVYSERLARVFYENYIGSIIDWYAATVFRRQPSLQMDGGLETGRKFMTNFVDDCDLKGTTLARFFRDSFVDALVAGASYILIDFPRVDDTPKNRAEEDLIGRSRAFLTRFESEELINWSSDSQGGFDWVVFRHKNLRQPSIETPGQIEETIWHYYDRQSYRTYRRVEHENNGQIELVAQGTHGLAGLNRVPVITLDFGQGLWLMNKAACLQLEHFNKSNALAWAITMGLFAMPVIYSDREWNQIVGESYFIQLGTADRFGWAEPDGKVYQIASDNLQNLKEEIYRVCYLSQASGEISGGKAQSALSKQLDFTITTEVLRAYGGALKDCITRVVTAICEARQDGITFAVSGLDEVDITDFTTDLSQAKALLEMGIESSTLQREVFERLAFKYLNDARQELKDQIAREIREQIAH
jgi:hypothetical protein